MVIGSRQRLATFSETNDLNVFVDNEKIKKVQSTKSLGLTIDEHLTWKNHINNITKKISSGISALKFKTFFQLQWCFPVEQLVRTAQISSFSQFIQSRID